MIPNSLFTQARKIYEDGWKPGWSRNPAVSKLEMHFKATLRTADQVLNEAMALKKAGKLSEKGYQEAIREFALKHAVPAIKDVGEAIKAAEAELAAQRAKLAAPASDPNDFAAAARRTEIRSWFLHMGRLKSLAVLSGDDVDPVLAQAVLDAPPQLSGLTKIDHEDIRTNLARLMHGKEFAQIEEGEGALEVARAALSTSLYHLRQEVQFERDDLPQFDKDKEAA